MEVLLPLNQTYTVDTPTHIQPIEQEIISEILCVVNITTSVTNILVGNSVPPIV